jgi:DNA repair protein RecO (recombination protein O)
MEKTEAILIQRTRYAESSLIIQWCSPELGLFRTLAKGALRPKSAFAGKLDLFITLEVGLVMARRSDLHTLTEAHWLQPRLGLRQTYGRVLAATYLSKLVQLVAEPDTALPEIYPLMSKALDYLADHDPSAAFLERFELRLAQSLGLLAADAVTTAAGGSVRLLQDSFHRRLPVQRQQVIDWIRDQKPGADPKKSPA